MVFSREASSEVKIQILQTQRTQSCAGNCCFQTQIYSSFSSITAFYHNLMGKAAGNCCFLVKSCAFSYTHRLVAILDPMFSIIDRNVSFFVHLYLKKLLVAIWNYLMSPSSSADMTEIYIFFYYHNLFHFACKSQTTDFQNLYSYKISSFIDFLLFINLIFSSYCLLQN